MLGGDIHQVTSYKYDIQTHEPNIRSKVKKEINYNKQSKLVD